ncbi:MAG: acyltransferase [Anaerolineales bacterium]|uniref:acyltransferase family protein n=1 Tax=Candidatus Villigracilis proximus TaxID=3140683 RepID=UPI003135F651|nr:acyltransferase [Anaerolineales bacterium]
MKDTPITKHDYIDALRGFAILAVVFYHSLQWVVPTSGLLNVIAEQGARGVQFFYVASALTLFLSLGTRKKIETRPVLNFFIRRFFRIAPLFYLAIILYTWYDGNAPRYFAPNGIQWWYIPLTAFFLNGWLPETINSVVPGGWSIAVEMIFYLTVPYLFSKLKDVSSTLKFIFISLVASKVFSILAVNFFNPFLQTDQQYLVTSFSNFPPWFFSQLPVLLWHGHSALSSCHSISRTKLETGMALPLLLSFFLFFSFLKAETYQTFYPITSCTELYFPFFLVPAFFPAKIFVNKITTLIGKLSFSIYLVHFIVLKVVGAYIRQTATPCRKFRFPGRLFDYYDPVHCRFIYHLSSY